LFNIVSGNNPCRFLQPYETTQPKNAFCGQNAASLTLQQVRLCFEGKSILVYWSTKQFSLTRW